MATRGQNSISRPALLGPTFLATVRVGLLLLALTWVIGPLTAQIAVLGLYASVLIGLALERDRRDREDQARQMGLLRSLSASLALAPEHEFFDQYSSFARGLQQLARQTDPILREFVLLKLSLISGEVDHLARGTVVFSSTETWRTVYPIVA